MPKLQLYVSEGLHERLVARAGEVGASVSGVASTLLDLGLRLGDESQPGVRGTFPVVEPTTTKRKSRSPSGSPSLPVVGPQIPVVESGPQIPDSGSGDAQEPARDVLPPAVKRHQRKDRPAIECPSRDLVDGRCSTCGFQL